MTMAPRKKALISAHALCAAALVSIGWPALAVAEPVPAKPQKATATKADVTTKTASRGDDEQRLSQSIVALVNDEPVTGYEITQRAALSGGGNVNEQAKANFNALIKDPKTTARLRAILEETVKANPGKSKDEILAIFDKKKKEFGLGLQRQAVASAKAVVAPGARKKALEELIDERLKLQEAKRLNVVVSEDEVTRAVQSIIDRNKITEQQLAEQLGGSIDPMKTRIRSTLSWNEVVRRRFGGQLTVTSKDVDKFVAASTTTGEDDVELQVQRIRIVLPAKINETAIAQRMQDAEKIRAKFTDCKTSSAIANGVPGAKFDEVVRRRPSSIPEPTRTLMLNAAPGEMLPPSIGDGSIELWVVCGREVVKAATQQRDQAEGELKQKEFEVMSRRHLKDLRQDAHIEYR